jgi:hypothetical protein
MNKSINDMLTTCTTNFIKRVGIENIDPNTENLNKLIDSHIINDNGQMHLSSATTEPTQQTVHFHHDSTSKDADNPNYNHDKMHCTSTDDGQWIPPNQQSTNTSNTQDNIRHIATMHNNNTKTALHMQSNSGANRIVTDNMKLLTNVTILKTPVPVGEAR